MENKITNLEGLFREATPRATADCLQTFWRAKPKRRKTDQLCQAPPKKNVKQKLEKEAETKRETTKPKACSGSVRKLKREVKWSVQNILTGGREEGWWAECYNEAQQLCDVKIWL